MKFPFLVGEKVYLRVLVESDINEEYLSWINDSEVTKYMRHRAFPTTFEDIREFIKRNKSSDYIFLAIVHKETDKHIGNILLGPIDWVNRLSELSMMIGNKKYWGKGCMAEAFKLITDHAFNKLNLHKLKAGTEAENESAVKLFKKLGWVQEGILKENNFYNGKFHDGIIFAIFNKKGI